MSGPAPGGPGIPARWTSSAKTGVGTSATPAGRVLFSIRPGLVDEIYYPRVDQACTRDLGLILSDERGYFAEEKRSADTTVAWIAPGVPGFRQTNRLPGGHRIVKTTITHPERDALLQHVALDAAPSRDAGFHLTVLLAPHLANRGGDNSAWIGDYKGMPMVFAAARGVALALASDAPWLTRSVGYVGSSDAWQDVSANGRMTRQYDHAGPGNVALAGEIDLAACDGRFTLAVGFGATPIEAGQRARHVLQGGFDSARDRYTAEWTDWASGLPDSDDDLERASRAVLRVHESTSFPGGTIASLSIPWGFAKGDDDIGGYHLVWPRDLVETMGGLLAAGALSDALRCLEYLRSTQEADGHWPQNMWLDGSPYWGGVQMDETALPILAVDLARRSGCPVDDDEYWPMVRAAAGYIVGNGPVTGQDRWEEDAGYSPFTLGAEVAGLLAAADMARRVGEHDTAAFLEDTADAWNEGIERWIYVTGTDLAAEVGVEGYYVRVAPPDVADAGSPADGFVPIKNRPPGESRAPASEIVSPDALALVRFGLRAADDPRIVSTIAVIDHEIRAELPSGPAWYRYTGDGYGEHPDGAPFDGTGVGRPWPLLTGERAHYELAAGRVEKAGDLAATMAGFADDGMMLPEQVWDAADIEERELRTGRPTGSAMPLAWAHAEYLKLRRSLRDGAVFDRPPRAHQRYVVDATPARYVVWSPNQRCRSIPHGTTLRIHLRTAGSVHWSSDGWTTSTDTPTRPMLTVHVVDLPTVGLEPGSSVVFTVRHGHEWEGVDHAVGIA